MKQATGSSTEASKNVEELGEFGEFGAGSLLSQQAAPVPLLQRVFHATKSSVVSTFQKTASISTTDISLSKSFPGNVVTQTHNSRRVAAEPLKEGGNMSRYYAFTVGARGYFEIYDRPPPGQFWTKEEFKALKMARNEEEEKCWRKRQERERVRRARYEQSDDFKEIMEGEELIRKLDERLFRERYGSGPSEEFFTARMWRDGQDTDIEADEEQFQKY
ncbi:uncharacterized protein LODBEIA_P55160 [Lodderomyces beijingensis]|uniref:Uncharacterized protein n=1 Tax=Lodderomyces beijingensis TaxID=1775926 RepID=A0ABP0ZT43_9ASCO